MKPLAAILLAGIGAIGIAQPLRAQGQSNATVAAAEAADEAKEKNELSQAVSDAASSPTDYIHALERHLIKYPYTKQRAGIEKALAKAAMDTNDRDRVILYGERILARESPDDMQLIDRVTRALIEKGDSESAKRDLPLIKRYEVDVQASRSQQPPGHLSPALWSNLLDSNMARAMALEARATGNAGNPANAAKIAEQSWAMCPTGEGARAAGYWLGKLDRNREAIEYYADAFTLEDPRSSASDRASDRALLGELYRKVNKSEKGLGELLLQAYDRTSALMAARRAAMKIKDPNADTVELLDFILPAVDGAAPLRVSSLKGKTIVMDFWATWCVPCREQHPLIENVKKHFAGAPDVVFLPIDADDDLSLAAPFVKQQGWESGYFEAGLSRRFNISSIPTILIVDPSGQMSSLMAGFEPKRFEAVLTERIEEASVVSRK